MSKFYCGLCCDDRPMSEINQHARECELCDDSFCVDFGQDSDICGRCELVLERAVEQGLVVRSGHVNS